MLTKTIDVPLCVESVQRDCEDKMQNWVSESNRQALPIDDNLKAWEEKKVYRSIDVLRKNNAVSREIHWFKY